MAFLDLPKCTFDSGERVVVWGCVVNTHRKALCRLCGDRCELCESHIFPRSFLKLVRDQSSNKFYEVHDKARNLIQDGPKERLLCAGCEQRISRYEKYFKEALHLSRHGIEIVHSGGEAVIHNLDYGTTKLFLLSILWRMSISSLPQCQAVSLGETEDVIRRMVLQGTPGGSQEFPICAVILLIDGKMQEGLLCTPFQLIRNDVYALIVGGILYVVSVREGHVFLSPRYLLSESGDWIMPVVEWDKIPFLEEFFTHQFQSECPVRGTPGEGT